nr:zf-BED domain-containing protein [Tanacetum cinerariifolium]
MNDLVYVMYNLKLSGREERKRKEEDLETFHFEDVDSDDEWITKENEDLTNVYENESTTHGDSGDDDFLKEAVRNQYGRIPILKTLVCKVYELRFWFANSGTKDKWSAATFSVPFLSLISISNSCKSKIHRIRRGLAYCFLNKCLRAE